MSLRESLFNIGNTIARRLPTSLDDLQNLRGLPRGEQDAILAAVSRARASASL